MADHNSGAKVRCTTCGDNKLCSWHSSVAIQCHELVNRLRPAARTHSMRYGMQATAAALGQPQLWPVLCIWSFSRV